MQSNPYSTFHRIRSSNETPFKICDMQSKNCCARIIGESLLVNLPTIHFCRELLSLYINKNSREKFAHMNSFLTNYSLCSASKKTLLEARKMHKKITKIFNSFCSKLFFKLRRWSALVGSSVNIKKCNIFIRLVYNHYYLTYQE